MSLDSNSSEKLSWLLASIIDYPESSQKFKKDYLLQTLLINCSLFMCHRKINTVNNIPEQITVN